MKKLIVALVSIISLVATSALADETVFINKTGENGRLIVTVPDKGDIRISNAWKTGTNSWMVMDEDNNITTVIGSGAFDQDRDDD
jgi:hypothetical protein